MRAIAPSPTRHPPRTSTSSHDHDGTAARLADFGAASLELEVTCQRCGHVAMVDDKAPRLRNQRLAGRRYRSAQCGAIGLPSLGTRALAEHAGKLKVDLSGGELPGRRSIRGAERGRAGDQ